jgi:hypothetical protein
MPKSKGNACNAYFFSISLPPIFCDLDEGDEGYMHALKHKVASMEWSVIDLHLFCLRFMSACFVVVSTPREIDPEETERSELSLDVLVHCTGESEPEVLASCIGESKPS